MACTTAQTPPCTPTLRHEYTHTPAHAHTHIHTPSVATVCNRAHSGWSVAEGNGDAAIAILCPSLRLRSPNTSPSRRCGRRRGACTTLRNAPFCQGQMDRTAAHRPAKPGAVWWLRRRAALAALARPASACCCADSRRFACFCVVVSLIRALISAQMCTRYRAQRLGAGHKHARSHTHTDTPTHRHTDANADTDANTQHGRKDTRGNTHTHAETATTTP